MDRHVVIQISLAFEGPATVWAAVRSLSGVDSHVNCQRPLGGESSAAFAAAVRLLIGVSSHVDLQLLARQEHFAANVTEVRPLSVRVNLLMLSQRPRKFETPSANLTAVRSLPRVGHLVAGQRSVVAEGFAAHAAEVRLFVGVSPAVSL